MNTFKRSLVLLFFLILIPFSIRSEEFRPIFREHGSLIFSPMVGGYLFPSKHTFQINDPNHELEHSYSLGLRTGYEITREFDIEANFNFVPTSHNVGDVNIYLYHLDLVFNVMNFGRVTPYVDFGLGGSTFSGPNAYDETDFMIAYSAGLKIFIIESLAFRFEARGYTKFNETHTNLNFSGGLVYYANFKKNRDTDGDGYIDRFDLCPNIRESNNEYLDEDGCPERTKPQSIVDKKEAKESQPVEQGDESQAKENAESE